MSWERAGRLAWIAPLLTLGSEVAFYVIADYPDSGSEGAEVFFLLTFLTYAVVGALIASRHPRNPVGWLFCAVGLHFAGSEVLYAYARDPAEPTGHVAAAWFYTWTGEPSAAAVVLLVLLFPTGSFLSRRWRLAGLGSVAASAVWALALAFDPGPLRPVETIENPLGIDKAGAVLDPIAAFGPVVLLGVICIAVAGAIARFRRARARERQQLKWLALGASYLVAVVLATVVLLLLVDTDRGVWDLISALVICSGIAALPLAAFSARLRDQVDLDALGTDLRGVVSETVQPAHVSLWLRSPR